jgi:hypothetical protein
VAVRVKERTTSEAATVVSQCTTVAKHMGKTVPHCTQKIHTAMLCSAGPAASTLHQHEAHRRPSNPPHRQPPTPDRQHRSRTRAQQGKRNALTSSCANSVSATARRLHHATAARISAPTSRRAGWAGAATAAVVEGAPAAGAGGGSWRAAATAPPAVRTPSTAPAAFAAGGAYTDDGTGRYLRTPRPVVERVGLETASRVNQLSGLAQAGRQAVKHAPAHRAGKPGAMPLSTTLTGWCDAQTRLPARHSAH